MWLSQAVDPGKVFLRDVSVIVYERVQYVYVYANLYAYVYLCVYIHTCARRGVVVLQCILVVLIHSLDRIEEKLPKKEGVVHPSSMLWLHPCECVYVCMFVSVCVEVMYLYVSGLCVCV